MNAPIPQGSISAGFAGSRKLVGLERLYRCESCSAKHSSWSRLRACPDCGESLGMARIKRAALI